MEPNVRSTHARRGLTPAQLAEWIDAVTGHHVDTEAVRAARERPWSVGPDALGAVASVLSGLRRLEDATSTAMVAPTVDIQLATMTRFVREASSAHRRWAVTLAAEMNTYRGWLAVDLADWATAGRRLNDATALAVESQAHHLLVEATGFKSYAALRRGDMVEAIALRHAAQPLAHTPVERAVAGLHLARTLAIAGDTAASDRALAEADGAMAESIGVEREDHHYYVTDPWLQVQHGLVHAWSGRTNQAVSDIENGLTGMPASQRGSSWALAYQDILEKMA